MVLHDGVGPTTLGGTLERKGVDKINYREECVTVVRDSLYPSKKVKL